MKTKLHKKLLAFALVCFALLLFGSANSAYAGNNSENCDEKEVVMFMEDMGFNVLAVHSTNDGSGNYIVQTDAGEKLLVVVCEKGIIGVLDDPTAGSL